MIEFSEHMVNRYYKIVLMDNSIIDGKCVLYIPDKDNEPEIDSIWIETDYGTVELFQNEIKSFLNC